MKVLHVDINHPLIIDQLTAYGFQNEEDYISSKKEIEDKIAEYDGLIIRSRFTIDRTFLDAAKNLKFIGRLGAGLENIDTEYALEKGVQLFSAPEGNRNAVGEHTLGMLLSLFNKFRYSDHLVRKGLWLREEGRGLEIEGKTIGIIGYGNMGKSFAKVLKGFDCEVLCFDLKENVGDDNARQVSLKEFQEKADVVSLHTPLNASSVNMINAAFINGFKKNFWFLTTARGNCTVTADVVEALKSGKILGAGLDVLEYEKKSFENLFTSTEEMPEALQFLIKSDQVILTPHVAGWTVESYQKLAQTIVDKIKANF